MYLIPANSKKGQLIFNMFRPIDLIIFAVGACTTLILMFAIQATTMFALIIKLAPICHYQIIIM